MRKVIKIIKPMTEEEKIEYFCDDCGKWTNKQCILCFSEVCHQCGIEDPKNHEDYPDYFCKACWGLGDQYRTRIEQLQEQIDKLNTQWEDECKLRRKSNNG